MTTRLKEGCTARTCTHTRAHTHTSPVNKVAWLVYVLPVPSLEASVKTSSAFPSQAPRAGCWLGRVAGDAVSKQWASASGRAASGRLHTHTLAKTMTLDQLFDVALATARLAPPANVQTLWSRSWAAMRERRWGRRKSARDSGKHRKRCF